MMCHRIGRPPISTIGLGRNSVSSRRRVPNPPHRTTTFIVWVPGNAAAAWHCSVVCGNYTGPQVSYPTRDQGRQNYESHMGGFDSRQTILISQRALSALRLRKKCTEVPGDAAARG